MERARPPDDISPAEFFLEWVPAAVAGDAVRRSKLSDVDATVEFSLDGPDGGTFRIRIRNGDVSGSAGGAEEEPDLRVELAVDTWRRLNRGELSAPEAVLRRHLRFTGSFLLGLRLHLILG